LEGFVARIDPPALTTIGIEFCNQLIFEVRQLSRFVVRAHRLNPFNKVYVDLRKSSASIHVFQKGSRICRFGILRRGLDWQLSFITEILGYLSPSLSSVKTLGIHGSGGEEDVDLTQFLELFRPFADVSAVHISGQLVPATVHALATEGMAAGVLLPRLTELNLYGYSDSLSVLEAAEKFVAIRKLSGQDVSLLSN